MDPQSVLLKCQAEIAGLQLSFLWRGHGSAIFLEFGTLTSAGQRLDGSERHPVGEFSVGIEWSWRIENSTSIICGSWSEENIWDAAFDLLRKQTLTGFTTYGRLPELNLQFENGHHLLSFNTSNGQPEWSVVNRRQPEHVTLNVKNGELTVETPE